jgi:hypothetical protein
VDFFSFALIVGATMAVKVRTVVMNRILGFIGVVLGFEFPGFYLTPV